MANSKIFQFSEADIRAYNQLVDPALGSKISDGLNIDMYFSFLIFILVETPKVWHSHRYFRQLYK